MKRKPMPPEDLQELWRPAPGFVGPLLPPMLLWFARGRPQSAWEIEAEVRFAMGVRRWEKLGDQRDLFEALIDAKRSDAIQ